MDDNQKPSVNKPVQQGPFLSSITDSLQTNRKHGRVTFQTRQFESSFEDRNWSPVACEISKIGQEKILKKKADLPWQVV